MKNLLLGALCIVVMSAAGFGGYTYYENQKQEQMDPWIKANLAALADLEKPTQGEGGGIVPKEAKKCFRLDQCHVESGEFTLIYPPERVNCPSEETGGLDDDWYSLSNTCYIY